MSERAPPGLATVPGPRRERSNSGQHGTDDVFTMSSVAVTDRKLSGGAWALARSPEMCDAAGPSTTTGPGGAVTLQDPRTACCGLALAAGR